MAFVGHVQENWENEANLAAPGREQLLCDTRCPPSHRCAREQYSTLGSRNAHQGVQAYFQYYVSSF